ncbi:bifunctional folylpolyglutamate synthase/dihydrofolate synthase [Acholeplasma vituli]|uniref:tetrahydrofolate synthase n=1 Tax=Paracholeplasma vituli TaxID=69473 RepID=A0ABT2PVR8_9MOLU|nr:folylpolyglutamate synthase/dihydrofolate synthase family protein [Paracholeplasma vituli]MCU0105055.1 bifunctional folylpolyglutamate synthase/dihydrofolate synthase [Paracholeplasma vituli]
MFKDIVEAIAWIEHQVKFKPKTDLNRMRAAALALGNPQDAYKIIHVGGTNGKGSVVSYLSTILSKQMKVGTYTSPYILKFNERIQVNLEMIPDADLLVYINEIHDFNETFHQSYGETLSFFELVTLIAFKYFKDQKVDLVVLEVGLGGLLDATNICNPIASVITNIGFDHMQQLGNTLESIAFNKLGIVKPNIPLFTSVDEALIPQFEATCKSLNAPLISITDKHYVIESNEPLEFIYEYHYYQPRLQGLYQAKNATLAISVVNYLFPKTPIRMIKEGIHETAWPGRFEVFSKHPVVILDGAHNRHGIEALCKSIESMYPNRHIHSLFCAMSDKETEIMLNRVSSISDSVTLTHFDYKRTAELSILLEQTHHKNKKAIENPKEAFESILSDATSDDVIIITGSLYFVSYIRPYLIERFDLA